MNVNIRFRWFARTPEAAALNGGISFSVRVAGALSPAGFLAFSSNVNVP